MRTPLAAMAALLTLLCTPAPTAAQEAWIEYVDCAERFSVNFPGRPTITETTYAPQIGPPLPARVYTVAEGPRRYTVRVVSFGDSRIDAGDVRAAIAWEAWNLRKRGGEVTYDAFAQMDRIEGHQLHITNPDGTFSFIAIHLYARRLYVLEARVPKDVPTAPHFQQSLTIYDAKGVRVRYNLDEDGNRTTRVGNYQPIRCE